MRAKYNEKLITLFIAKTRKKRLEEKARLEDLIKDEALKKKLQDLGVCVINSGTAIARYTSVWKNILTGKLQEEYGDLFKLLKDLDEELAPVLNKNDVEQRYFCVVLASNIRGDFLHAN